MSISNLRPNLQTCAASAVTAFLSLAPAAAMAQDAAPQTAVEETASDDIVVTAQKRSERLQDVPISISAIGGDALQR